MSLEMAKLIIYGFIGIIGVLVVYITALALFLNNKINKLKE